MTRILYWNIENFSSEKIDSAGPTPLLRQLAVDRRGLIESILAQNPPDIFVIVEVYARTMEVGEQGVDLGSSSPSGLAAGLLLARIRNGLGASWCMVPPLYVGNFGYREAVAVYYNAAKLQFSGPYVWCQPGPRDLIAARPPTAANIAAASEYNADWRTCLPPVAGVGARTWIQNIGGVAHNVQESRSAGQWQFSNALGRPIHFPGVDNRSPFYTRFVEVAGGRVLKVFTVHTSPDTAKQGVERLIDIQELPPAANEVTVIVGDFNVDTFDSSVNGAYRKLGEAGYELLLDPRDAAGNLKANRKPYCMTHLLPLQLATPWNDSVGGPDPQHNVYPRFGYTGSVGPGTPPVAGDSGALDNALVRYGVPPPVPAPPAPPVPAAAVVNTVVGKPYNKGPKPVPAGVTAELTGGAVYATSMGAPLPANGVAAPLDPTDFLGWHNYNKIRSTSDHLALLLDV